ncbi:hypothetical protein OsI_08796 [Oryza sativa Indica Group]|uniref:Uncharacterized protein n=1 Tax=Oryza sativa subsp. indica TaxID=39946 RepID=A2X979_ORYSI|nr:hypothetical protein OsI_08796 [Oryza sativa Indica Group]
MALHDLHSRLSPRPRPANGDPGGTASFSVRPFCLSLSSGLPQAPSRDHLRTGHGVTSASARGFVASAATRDSANAARLRPSWLSASVLSHGSVASAATRNSSAVDVATSRGSPPPPPRATPPAARGYVASPPRRDTPNPSTRDGG